MRPFDWDPFEYVLPPELLAHEGATPRDAARLLVYDTATETLSCDIFRNLSQYLPAESFLVLNDTKVVPARLEVTKPTGGKVELLLLLNEWRPGELTIRCIADRKITVGQQLTAPEGVLFTVREQQENIFLLEPSISIQKLLLWLEKYGTTPVPKYLQPAALSEEETRARYQSIFAKSPASVAAPTASLHFTPEVFHSLDKKGIGRAYVTLHVGLGTFAPITEETIQAKKLHQEVAEITDESAKYINEWKKEGKQLIAVGTTATRVLESHSNNGEVTAGSGVTDIFIQPGYTFQAVDGLLTNFHLPKSSLMMLVAAFLQHKHSKRTIKELYAFAIQEKFRFYSFGDAMLIL